LNRAKQRDEVSQKKLHELEAELLDLKEEFASPKVSQDVNLLKENIALKAEMKLYKDKYNKLTKDLAEQIEFLKIKLGNAEKRFEEKYGKTQKNIKTVIDYLDNLLNEWHKEPTLTQVLTTSKELLKKSLTVEIDNLSHKGIQTEGNTELIKCEDTAIQMKKVIEDMKTQMRELELMSSIEIQKLTREKNKQEIEYSLTIEKLSKELEISKQQMKELREQTNTVLEYMNRGNKVKKEKFSVEKQKTAELRLELNKLDKDIQDLLNLKTK